jgi:hypothetical protein
LGISSSAVFVESAKIFFDSVKENTVGNTNYKKITITSQDSVSGAAATAVVSAAGTITSFVISDGGYGYTSAPDVIVSNPVGLGTTYRASGSATITNGVVTSINVSAIGYGYTSTNPPLPGSCPALTCAAFGCWAKAACALFFKQTAAWPGAFSSSPNGRQGWMWRFTCCPS